jgi:hypothetical protein
MYSIQRIAKITGALYLLMIPLGVMGLIYIPEVILVSDDIMATIANIKANEMLFRLGIVSALLVQLVQIALVLALYKLLSPVNTFYAKLMVIFALVAVPIAMLTEASFGVVLFLIHNAEQSPLLIDAFIYLHEYGVFIAQIFWGLWLFPMGYLIYKSNYIPKFIGVLLMIGCFGYFVDSFIFFLYPDFGIMFSAFLFIGEVVLPLWLVFKGVDQAKYEEAVLVTNNKYGTN